MPRDTFDYGGDRKQILLCLPAYPPFWAPSVNRVNRFDASPWTDHGPWHC